MGFEQIPNNSTEPSKEQPPYPGWVLENGIWRNPTKEEDAGLIDQDKEDDTKQGVEKKKDEGKDEGIEKIDEGRRELDKEYAELDNKKYITPNDKEKKAKIEEEHQRLSDQVKEIEKGKEIKKINEKLREMDEEHKKLTNKDFKTPEDIEKIARIEKEHEQLLKFVKGVDSKKEEKGKFDLLDSDKKYLKEWKKFQKAPDHNKVVNACHGYNLKELLDYLDQNQSNLSEEAKDWIKIKIDMHRKEISNLLKPGKQEKGKNNGQIIFGSKEYRKIENKYLSSEELILRSSDLRKKHTESKDKERKKQMAEQYQEILDELKNRKESSKIKEGDQNINKDKNGTNQIEKQKGKEKEKETEKEAKKQLEKMDILSEMKKILKNPEALSRILSDAFEISEDADVQEKWQGLKAAISKAIEAKGGSKKEKKEDQDVVKNAKNFIKKEMGEKKEDGKEKKESHWKTAFGVAGWSILLFLVLFMLAELKGVDYFTGLVGGKKKEKK